MDRRTLLKTGTMGFLGLGLGGCATGSGRESSLVLAPVRASWDRVIRTTVGLRPFRPSGFVLRAEKLDAKTVIHNYGHGGSGMSLSWGTAFMAAEIATQQEDRRAAVIGCGVVGLTTARQLQRRGFDVTIYAMAVPPDTTSNMSLAGFTPTSGLVETDQRTRAWDAQFRRAVEIALNQVLNRPLSEPFLTSEAEEGGTSLIEQSFLAGQLQDLGQFVALNDFLVREAFAAAPELRALEAGINGREHALLPPYNDLAPEELRTAPDETMMSPGFWGKMNEGWARVDIASEQTRRWIDLVVVRKEPFSTIGKRTNVLLMNEGGVLKDRTRELASASDVAGDSGFLTPTNDRDVVLATGDGYFMFGTPLAALWSAAHYGAAFLSVVFVNRSYSTGTMGLAHA
ncbi:MAG: FAD-dependent oxidoreductase, partial [Gemmatimonadetes bacterium]|nr:FAD-dependent oxidoreductase [Gemmatimonadota bacterium]